MLIDSHCHLESGKYKLSPDQLISEAQSEGVVGLVSIGTSIKDNVRVISLAESFPGVYTCIGIYPHEDIGVSLPELKNSLSKCISDSKKVVGIGECGIDISEWSGGRNLDAQIPVFEMQIVFAIENNLPLVIHNRNGDNEILQLLTKYKCPDLRGVVHCFSSDISVAREFWKLGFMTSFSGMITYPSRKALLDVVKEVPNDMFLVETDAPYLPPQSHRGEVNMPKYVKIVAEKVSEIKQIPFEDVSKYSFDNTCRLFGINLCL